jgi:hypothetical protein
MSPILSQLLMGLLFVTIGFISGAAISYWLLEREKNKNPILIVPPSREQTIPVEQAYEEVLRIYRDKVSEKILLKIDERMIPTRVDLNKPQLILVDQVVHEAMDWIGIQIQPQPVSGIAPVVPSALPLSANSPTTGVVKPAPMPSYELSMHPLEKANPKEKPAPRSFVEQIDDILQDMLELTPYKDQVITLAEDPKEGVIAWIGSKRYIGIDSIDDPDIQKLIKIAVAKWEKSMERANRTP